MSKKGIETSLKILATLALYEEMSQYDIPLKVEKHYSTILRQLRRLEGRGLVQVLRTQPSKKKGKEKKIYGITFKGIIQILQLLENSAIDRVAEFHADKWLIFQEWTFLLKKYGDMRAALYFKLKVMSRHFNFLEGESIPPFPEQAIKQAGFTPKGWQEYQSESRLFFLENMKQECTDRFLGLNYLFGSRESLLFRFVLDKRSEEKRMLLKRARQICKHWLDNPRIREYIDKRFEQEKTVHKLVEEIEAQWEKTKKSMRAS